MGVCLPGFRSRGAGVGGLNLLERSICTRDPTIPDSNGLVQRSGRRRHRKDERDSRKVRRWVAELRDRESREGGADAADAAGPRPRNSVSHFLTLVPDLQTSAISDILPCACVGLDYNGRFVRLPL